jgi:hypothetical protein
MNGLALRLRMIVLHSIVAEREKEVRVRNGSPTVIMCMIKTRSGSVVAQKKNHQHPFPCFYQRLFHLPVLQFGTKVSVLFVFGKSIPLIRFWLFKFFCCKPYCRFYFY